MKYKKTIVTIAIILAILVLSAGIFFYQRQKIEGFNSSFNKQNDAYKKVLFATGQNQSISGELMSNFTASWSEFKDSYANSPISPYDSDKDWKSSIEQIETIRLSSKELVVKNELHEAHLELEKIRGVWQEVFVRNNVTMLGFYLTQYHDTMEIAISQADSLDYQALSQTCITLLETWQSVKEVKVDFTGSSLQDYDAKVKANTLNLEQLCNAAKDKNDSVTKETSSKLKGLFIPLYLKFG